MKDITGERFGKWVALERIPGKIVSRWICECSCGTVKSVRLSHLTGGESTSCGCNTNPDFTGKTFGKLLILRKADKVEFTAKRSDFKTDRPLNGSVWLAKCECGKEKFVRGGSLKHARSCGCGNRRESKHLGINLLFNGYKYSANKRNRKFEISRIEFEKLISSICFYCHSKPLQKIQLPRWEGLEERYIIYNGIDRIDNSLGYIEGNCVSCCKVCNTMKQELTLTEWFSHMKKVLKI